MGDKKMSSIVLVDLDHTLSDARWRDVWIKPKMSATDWDSYHSRMGDDAVIRSVADVVRAMKLAGADIYIVTSRNEYWRATTLFWLSKNNIPVDQLFMRPDDDNITPSAKLKVRQISRLMDGNELARISLVIDDREDVLAEFARIGICGLQVRLS
jgi:hypothetical protein